MHKSKLFVFSSLMLSLLFAARVAGADDDDHGRAKKKSSVAQNDFALFDGSNPANQPFSGAVCFAERGVPFTYHVAVANYGSDGVLRVSYRDGDWVQYPIAAGASFSLSQAAGSKAGKDRAIRVSNGTSSAQLAGVLSAQGARCASCDAVAEGGIGDPRCDMLVPNN